jgi:glycosyltransferase involved in cell wall biosynthesis
VTKRILVIDTGKEWGGGTNSLIELLKRIDRVRFDVTALFYYNYRKGDSDLRREFAAIGIPLQLQVQPRQPLAAKLGKELARGLLGWHRSWRRDAVHAIDRLWRIRPNAQRIARHLREGRFDLLYLNNQPASNLEGYLAAEAAGVPLVQHCRIDVKLKPVETAAVNRIARRIICVSQGVADSLVGQGVDRDKCAVVVNAIDGEQTLPDPMPLPQVVPGAVVIGSVGSLIARKANDHLLRAAAAVRTRCAAPFHLLLVGEGPERVALEMLARQLGLADRVSFAGFQKAPLPWVAAMDILVLASAKEGLPRAILEAMLLGKPVIASDVVGSRELVRPNVTGLLYPYGDADALANHLQRLLEHREERRRLGDAGLAMVREEHSIERYVAGVEAILGEAAGA